MLEELIQKYELCFRCLRCKKILNHTSFSDICQHEQIFHSFQIQQEDKQNLSNEDQININSLQNENNKLVVKHQNLNDLLTLIQNDSSLAQGTINLYKTTFSNLLETLNISNWESISGNDLIKYLKEKQLYSSNTINAITFLIKFFNIQMTVSQKKQIKYCYKMAEKKRNSNPHSVWNIELIQQFINQLLIDKKIVLAYRIYILYYSAARISELEQIKFETIISQGTINYIPKKQNKRGLKAQRCFILPSIVCYVTKQFITLMKINPLSTINIGSDGNIIQSKSFQNDLKRQIKFQKLQITDRIQNQIYISFLEQFQYHDLRYSRLNHMRQQGYSKEIIRKFVSHQKLETTEHYLRNNQADYIDFNKNNNDKKVDENDTVKIQILLEFNFRYYYDKEKEILRKTEQFQQ